MSQNLHHPMAWSIKLNHVPSQANAHDIERAISLRAHQPRHIELGPVSYDASDAEVSVHVRSHLAEYGTLGKFYLPPMTVGKRVKATTWYRNDSDASAACSLKNRQIEILGANKLTVTPVQSVKVKVASRIYLASREQIEEESKTWKQQRVTFHHYQSTLQHSTTLKLEGKGNESLLSARKTLDTVLGGKILKNDEIPIWHRSLNRNDVAYQMFGSIGQELEIVIAKDKLKRHLKFHGLADKYRSVVLQVVKALGEAATAYELRLSPPQFSAAIQGGFTNIEQALGKGIAIFIVVSRIIIINGSQSQYERAIQILDPEYTVATTSPPVESTEMGLCPIGSVCPTIPYKCLASTCTVSTVLRIAVLRRLRQVKKSSRSSAMAMGVVVLISFL